MDYIIVSQRDISHVRILKSVRGVKCQTDHHHLFCKVQQSCQTTCNNSRQKSLKKVNVNRVKVGTIRQKLCKAVESQLHIANTTLGNLEADWKCFKDAAIYTAALNTLCSTIQKHQDWFMRILRK